MASKVTGSSLVRYVLCETEKAVEIETTCVLI